MSNQVKELIQKVEGLLGGSDRVDVDMNEASISDVVVELKKARTRLELSKQGLAVDLSNQGSGIMTVYRIGSATPSPTPRKAPEKKAKTPTKLPVPKRHQHSYVAPRIAKDIIDLLADEASHIIQLVGPTQCGKSTLVRYLGAELGRRVFQINCRGDMGSEAFVGEKTIELDEAAGQNKIVYQKGLIEQAMTEGLDENGNEQGPAAILFIDEITSCPAHVAHVLNRVFESDDPRRTLVLDQDGGRMVRSHSQFRIIVAGNTAGRGAQEFSDGVYAAQLDALDLSLLHRISACFRMGYDRKVEKHILAEKVGDDKVAQMVIKFRDAIRGHVKAGKLTTPFSTKNIVDIANLYRVYGNLGKAVFYSVFEHLLPEERATYNEQAVAVFGKDLLKDYVESEVDYA
jgi:MoxR-like ATPase